jgi:hypothetical protein
MITLCNSCGNYTVKQGGEVAAARAMVKRLRSDLQDPNKRQTVIDRSREISQLMLEVDLLTHQVTVQDRPELTLVCA